MYISYNMSFRLNFGSILFTLFFALAGCVPDSLLQKFELWIRRHSIEIRSEAHYESTLHTWIDNEAYIEQTNARNLSYTLGHNQFSGMNADDFRNTILGFSYDPELRFSTNRASLTQKNVGINQSPKSVDWISAGAVTPVKDQGQCGSCWSFSSTGALEGAYFVSNKGAILPSFSEQQLVDCDNRKNRQTSGKDMGCNGGLMDNAFDWIRRNGGLCSETDYPYVSGKTKTEGTCQSTCKSISGSTVTSFVDVDPSNDGAMMSALSNQPVSVAIEADERDFQLYKSGVFTGKCGTKLDHGVLAVGYGTDETGLDYYMIKNSWGTSWGLGGYIKLGKGVNPTSGEAYNGGDGQCGVLLSASYPVV